MSNACSQPQGAVTAVSQIEALLARHIYRPHDHHTPTRFTSDAEFLLFPHQRGIPYARYRAHLRMSGVSCTISCLPHFLQLDPLMFWTHRDARIPHASVSHTQSAAICAMVQQLAPECIVATPSTALAMETALAAQHIEGTFHWYLISKRGDTEPALANAYVRDVQLIPGVSIAYQCAALRSHWDTVHLAPEFTWHFDQGRAIATTEHFPVPLVRIEALCIRADAVCVCGETRYVIT